MIEIFKKQGIVHEVERNGERIVYLAGADYAPGYDAVTISVCENCGHIETSYAPLPDNILESHTVNKLEMCEHCPENK